MKNGKQYLILKKWQNGTYPARLAYWFDERTISYPWGYTRTCVPGFYRNKNCYIPHMDVAWYKAMDEIPVFTKWVLEEPVEGERYLVYRVGSNYRCSPHYTIRKYRKGSFGSKDVKYWIRLDKIIK